MGRQFDSASGHKMKKLIDKILNLFGIKVVKIKRYKKLVNTEKNYTQSVKNTEEFKKIIKELVIKGENLPQETYQKIKSQNLQDLVALDLFGFKSNGIFIEAGACDGILNSNTFLLEKNYEWTGLLVEPISEYYLQLVQNRDVFTSNVALSQVSNKHLDFLITANKDLSTIRGYEDNDFHSENRQKYSIVKVPTKTLDQLIIENLQNFEIDFLSLDTEGSEFEIIKNLDLKKHKIKVICVEHNLSTNRDIIYSYLKENNYKKLNFPFLEIDDFYILNTFSPKNRYFHFI
jgi:FkbM family methyltransferase